MARTGALALQVDVFKREIGKTHAQTMAAAARSAFKGAQAENRTILGRDIAPEIIVDGRKGAALESVRPGGTIVGLFPVGAVLLEQAVDFAITEFMNLAPVGRKDDPHPGLYRKSLRMLVNGSQRSATRGSAIRFEADDVISLTNLVPYSRRIEVGRTESGRPFSLQVPNGVFQALRQRLQSRYGGLIRIDFTFEHYGAEFAVGAGKRGSAVAQKRAASYPTITLRLK